jgi:diguanylate cyclase (GGDEF)-like protein
LRLPERGRALSFKLKLVAYFLLLSLLPLAAAFGGFSAVLAKSESRLVDAQLQAGLRAGLAAYAEELDYAEAQATGFATNPDVQDALAIFEIGQLYEITSRAPTVRIESAHSFRVGHAYDFAAERRVDVFNRAGDKLGTVVASVPLDDALAERLRSRSGLQPGQRLAILKGNRIVASSPGLGGTLDLAKSRAGTVDLGGTRFRSLAAAPRKPTDDVRIAILSPQSWIDAANRSAKLRLLAALAAALGFVALVAYLEGRSIVRTLRKLVDAAHGIAHGRLSERVGVRGRDEFAELGQAFNEMAAQLQGRLDELEAERGRLREATVRFGEALAATHDADQLLRAVVETAVESTRATGGLLISPDGTLVQVGDPDRGAERFELPLAAGRTSFGTLILCGPEFSIHDIEAASILVGHAVVALENARLHRILERQALVDGLTGLANRRAAEETLDSELARAKRFSSPLAVVMADLDGFKGVNDQHGHPAGDVVLRELAEVLNESLREIDTAARWGGEEFCLILPGTDAPGAAQVAERIRAALAGLTILTAEGTPIHITASFGVAAYPAVSFAAALIAAADAALYRAKRGGKNRVAIATSETPVDAA